MPKLTINTILAVVICFSGCAAPQQIELAMEQDRDILIKMNETLVRSQLIDRDTSFISKIAVEQLRVLAPGGMIEGKTQVIEGLSGWNVQDVKLTGTEVVFYQNIAIVSGRMDIDGTMEPIGRWGPLKYMSTWIKDENSWQLVSRSLTPCLKPLIKIGRC